MNMNLLVCSTSEDLIDERLAVLDGIRRLRLQDSGMELFGARPEAPIETCLDEVRKADVLVFIVGHRYGSMVATLGKSFTEAEYDEAIRLAKRCLIYIRDENVPVLPRHVERDPSKIPLLESWKLKLFQHNTVATFQTSADLAVQVVADLSRLIQDRASTFTSATMDAPRSDGAVLTQSELRAKASSMGLVEHTVGKGVPFESYPTLIDIPTWAAQAGPLPFTASRGAFIDIKFKDKVHGLAVYYRQGLYECEFNVYYENGQSRSFHGAGWIPEIGAFTELSDTPIDRVLIQSRAIGSVYLEAVYVYARREHKRVVDGWRNASIGASET